MNHSYRMRYSEDPIDDIRNIRNIRIIVRMMTGVYHTLFTDNDDETFLDVKMALLPYLHKPFEIDQLVFQMKNGEGYNPVDDDATVSSLASQSSQSHRVLTLELLTKEREWTQDEQQIIDETSRSSVLIEDWMFTSPGRIDAVIHGLESNDYIESLTISRLRSLYYNVHRIMKMMDVVRDKTTLTDLVFSDNHLDRDEMKKLFDIIGNTSISRLTISNVIPVFRNIYRMDDLVELLRRNTSLRRVDIYDTYVKIDGDLSELASVLLANHNLILNIRNNQFYHEYYHDRKSTRSLIDSLQLHPIRLVVNMSDDEIIQLTYDSEKQLEVDEIDEI